MSEELEEEQPKKDRWWHHILDGCCTVELFGFLFVFVGLPAWWIMT